MSVGMSPSREGNTSLDTSLNTSLNTSSKKDPNRLAFQLQVCKVCGCELLRSELSKHEGKRGDPNGNYCREAKHMVGETKVWTIDIPQLFNFEKDFGSSLIIGDNLLLTSTFTSTSESSFLGRSEFDLPGKPCMDRCLFLVPELMKRFKLPEGHNVTLHLFKSQNRSVETQVFTVYTTENIRPKSMLTICVKKNSDFYKTFSESPYNKAMIVMDNSAPTVELSKIVLDFEKPKGDVFKHLSSCCAVQKLIRGQNIRHDQKSLPLEKTTLKIIDKTTKQSSLSESFQSLSLSTKCFYQVTDDTKVIFLPQPELCPEETKLVGYEDQFSRVHNLIVDSSTFCEANNLHFPLPRSILLTGATGTGKTIAMRELFRLLAGKMNLIRIHASMFLTKQFEFERLENFFEMFVKLSPSVLFLDNLEDVANDKNNMESRVVSWLKVLLDSLPKSQPIYIIGACTENELLDTSLRRPGRFDVEIDFPIPSPATRKQILEFEIARTENEVTAKQIEEIAEVTHGYTGADLKYLCDEARHASMRLTSNKIIVTYESLFKTLKTMKPSVMREISLEKPNVSWSDIGGMQKIRHLLEESVVWPIKHPDAFLRMGIEPPRGILMYGPPGCCKTMIGKALATESGLNFFSIKGPELFNKWVGESERAIREIFRKARSASPSILFFDEIDALAAERGQKQSSVGDRVLAQLLTEIDGVEKLSQVVIVAATNRPDIVDKALLRPGRLDSMVYVPLPDLETRKEIFRIRTGKMPLDPAIPREEYVEKLAKKSDNYTGAEVSAVCQTAGLAALSDNIDSKFVKEDHFDAAFERVRPRIDRQMIDFYNQFAAKAQQ